MAIWQYDLTMTPSHETAVSTVVYDISSRYMELETWTEGVRSWGSMDGNRVDYIGDNDSSIFRVRFDLREPSVDFMKFILSLANQRNMTFEDDDGIQLRTTLGNLVLNMKSSEAYRFVSNPTKFLEEVSLE